FTSPPLIVKDKAIIGIGTFAFPTRGFIDAYDIETGKLIWRFYTIPGPGEPGNETWGRGDAWKYGGAAAWMPGTYDPELNLVYMGTGNPYPYWDGEVRPGDNLYSSSILALDPDTGKLKWYFQVTPHDVWEYDATSERVLVDIEIQGRLVKAFLQANKNGYFYVLDRTNGQLLSAKPFISRIDSIKGLDEKGRPIPGIVPTPEGAVYFPSATGAKNWNQMAYHPQTGYVYIPVILEYLEVKVVRVEPRKGVLYPGGEWRVSPSNWGGQLIAMEVKTGEIKWQYSTKYLMIASVLATAGGLVLTGDMEGNALAFDSSNGKLLWTFNTGSAHHGSPITYAVNGKQYIAVPSGTGRLWVGDYPDSPPGMPMTSTLFVFGLFEE
ncbi:MAG: PQQ-binding-like beta-propeller repeat protein, partial [Nitrospira sp.]|nr:PQQ-binding-like beta-propeller repeat protein [Nitrospira sp.]